MKKTSFVFIVLVLILLSACGVHSNKLFDIDYKTYSSKTLEFVTEKEIYTQDDTIIRYTLTNISDEESWINPDNACFELQKLVGNEWKWVGTKSEHVWTQSARLLPPNESETREIKLEDYYYLPLEKGEYRICIEGMLSNVFEIS